MDKNLVSSYSYRSLIADFLRFLRPYRRRFWLASLLRLAGDLTYLFTMYALSSLIAEAGKHVIGQSSDRVWFLLAAWTGTYLFVTATRQFAKYLGYTVSEKMQLDSVAETIRHLSRIDIAWHEKENSGNKMKRAQNGGEALDRLGHIWIDNVIEIVVNVTGMFIILAFVDRAVFGIMSLFLLTYFLISFPLSARASRAAREVNHLEEDFTGVAFEIVNNIRTVKVMGLFAPLLDRLAAAGSATYAAIVRRIRRFRMLAAIMSYWSQIFRTIMIAMIVYGILHGRQDVAFLIFFNFYFTNLRTSVDELSQISQDIIIAKYKLGRLREIFSEPVQIDDDTDKIDFPRDWKTIFLRQVSFAYGEQAVLKNISFDIHRGEKIGIVGLSGAGKSTLFKLLLKEYEDFTGEIFFDDISIRRIKKSSYFRRAAVVLQETEVFNLSLRDNIELTNGVADEERLGRAVTAAHVADFLPKLPQGLDTLIGEKGVKLSGGEKQRLGIARAIVREPDILFLDEATSHLDLESEEKIQDSLHRFFRQVTAVVIAHRLTTIQEMDRILLIENGELLESGSFAELHGQKGRFWQLWEMQRL